MHNQAFPQAAMHSQSTLPNPQPLTATHFSDPASTNPTYIPRNRHDQLTTAWRMFIVTCSLIGIGAGAYAVEHGYSHASFVTGWTAIGLGILALGLVLAQYVLDWNRNRRREMSRARTGFRMEGV